MVTNALLNGIADTFAQSLSALRSQPSIHRLPSSKKDPGGVSIEIHELGEKPLMPTHHNHSFPAAASSPFNFDRLVRFMMWGKYAAMFRALPCPR